MYRFFNGTLNHEKGLICEVKATSEFFPYTEPQIGDYINLPLDANDLDQEVWVIKERVVWPDQIEYLCKRFVWED